MNKALFNIIEAAHYLGIERTSMDTLRTKHKVFEPSNTKFSFGKKYHIDQLKIIEGVILEAMSPDDGLRLWEAKRSLIGKRSS